MIINIDSIEKIRKIVIEFDSNDQETDFQNNQNTKDIKTKSDRSLGSNRVHLKQEYQTQDNVEYIDLSESKEQARVSQEIVEKPVIPDRKRETKVSSTMQNLSI